MDVFLIVTRIIVGFFGLIWNVFAKLINSITSVANKSIRKRNDAIKRGVVENKQSDVPSLLGLQGTIHNTLISGGSANWRTSFISSIVDNAIAQNTPVVVIHEGNTTLSLAIRQKHSSAGNTIVIDSSNPIYEPFYKLSTREICTTITDTATKDYDLKKNGIQYIEGMCAFLQAKRGIPSLRLFGSCPHSDLFDAIDAQLNKGNISDVQAQDIRSRIMMGQSERFKIESIIADWIDQSECILSQAKASRASVLNCIAEKRVICVDIATNSNELLINSIISQIRQSLRKGERLLLVTDNLSSANNELLRKLLCEHNERCQIVTSSSDVFSMCGGDDKVFSTLVGNSERIVIMGHASGATCSKWAETIGYYNKEEETLSYQKGSMRHSPFSLFPGSNNSSTTSYSIRREYIVKPEEINRMSANEVYFYDHSQNQLIHTFLV